MLIVDKLIEFTYSVHLSTIYEQSEEYKIYLALILLANDMLAARKSCSHADPEMKCY